MNQEFNNTGKCPCCGRHCSVDNLHCPRGQAHFGQEPEHSKHAGRHGGNIKRKRGFYE